MRRVYEAVQDYLEHGDRGRAAATLGELVHPDCGLVPFSALSSGSIGPYRGADGMLDFYEAVRENWSSFAVMPEDYVDVPPDTVVVRCRVVASGPDGHGYAVQVGHLIRVEEGKLGTGISFQSPALALEYAGVAKDVSWAVDG